MRGREQQLIDSYGGAKQDPQRRPGATAANPIRGVAADNTRGRLYHVQSNLHFGLLYPYTGY
jgi:hypothetical protein